MIDWLREHWPELLLAGLIFGTILLAFVLPGDTPDEPPEPTGETFDSTVYTTSWSSTGESVVTVVTHTIVPEGEGHENAYRLCDFSRWCGR